MNVCHIWERFWPLEIGGVERYILSLTSYLHKSRGIEFSLLTGKSNLLFVTKNMEKFEDAGFLKVYRLGPNPVDLFYSASFRLFGEEHDRFKKPHFRGLCHEAERSAVAKSADIFHIHGIWKELEYIDLGVYLSQHFHKPLVVTLHGGFVGDAVLGGMPLRKPDIKAILNYADAITTYSKEVLGTLQELGLGDKSHLITNFVDTWQFKKTTAPPLEHDDTAVYVGRLEPLQTPELLIEAFKKVHAQVPNAKLHIVGYGTLYEQLKNQIHEYGLDETVSLMGKQTDVRKFLWNSDIFIATNFGYIASLEAWSAGLAVIAPNFGILKETISHQDNGLLFKPKDADELALALIALLKDKELRKKLALNGTETVKGYDIRAVTPKMADVYKSVIKK